MNIYIETYGCQMNLSDSEIVKSVLSAAGYTFCNAVEEAEIVLLNTCSVRDNAERKIHERLIHLQQYCRIGRLKFVGVLGCMAERLADNLLAERNLVRLVAGPDEYRSLPKMLSEILAGKTIPSAIELSLEETYENIVPMRDGGVSAYVSIMRGCNNFCSYCVVPYTRGRERSASVASVFDDVRRLNDSGIKEVTLLGQNVNSYYDSEGKYRFPDLLSALAEEFPSVRFRFLTSHPKDFSEALVKSIATHENICNYVHLPVQSGSNRILKLMNRRYTKEEYLEKIAMLREYIPEVSLATDIIAGFPGETLADHNETLDLMARAEYDAAFMFRYSPREGTVSWKMNDDVPEEEKIRRLNEIIAIEQVSALKKNTMQIGKVLSVMALNVSRRNAAEWKGISDTAKSVVFPISGNIAPGDMFKVKIESASSSTLRGSITE